MKKLVSIILVLAVALAALPALAEQTDNEKAIAAAKTIFSIPEELSEFSLSIDDGQYDLRWNDKDYEKSVSVTLTSDFTPVFYSTYTYDDDDGLASFRKSELQAAAESFIKATVPALADRLVLNEDESSLNRFVFDRYENGVVVDDNRATVYVNKTTGEVRRYSLDWDFDGSFASNNFALTTDQAYEKLAENAVMTIYRQFDGVAIPVYVPNYATYVTAADGTPFEASYYASDNLKYAATDEAAEMSSASDGSGGYTLTTEEAAEVEQLGKLVAADKVKEIVASMPELLLPEGVEPEISYLSRKSKDEATYIIRCAYSSDNADAELTLDGETGEITDFYSYDDEMYMKSENPVSDEDCAATIDAFLAKTKSLEGYAEYESDAGDLSYSKKYVRMIDGIPYPADYKEVGVMKNSGKVQRYNENVPTAEIRTPASTVDKLAAVKAAFTAVPVYAYTEVDGESKPVEAYRLEANCDFAAVRAEDGAMIDYANGVVSEKVEKSDETDHWAWEMFDILRENDVYIEGTYSFDDEITAGDFEALLDKMSYVEPIFYRYAYYDYDEVEDDAASELPITREAAARTVAKRMGWEKIIDLDIYTTKFDDEADFTGKIGAAALLQGLGILQGDVSGSFYPQRSLTYGDAYAIAYRTILMRNEE